MFKALLNVGARRLAAPLPLQILQIIHAYHNLGGLLDDYMYIVMYVIIMIILFVTEVTAKKPLSGWPKAAFFVLTGFTMVVGVSANCFVYWHTHLMMKDQDAFKLGLLLIITISLAFEGTVKFVIHQIKEGDLIIPN
jgi:hypothetical protein